MHIYRTHNCGELRAADVGETVRLSGWVHRVRDHGGVLFIDLRDHYGITQTVADPDSAAFSVAETLRAETVIRVDGVVKARDTELVNEKIDTGDIELFISQIEILGPCAEIPLPVFAEPDYPEETRLKYRFLDLRRKSLRQRILLRAQIINSLRQRMSGQGFIEFQTPILTASSPEGARDFLVPSRLHPGKFYALPQAPQQFKQFSVIAGFDKYFQIAPCFRDEDPRSDRSPGEFYQLDLEMAFASQEDVFNVIEPVLRGLFEEFGNGGAVTAEFPRLRYRDAMRQYGTDKPDLRNPLRMCAVSEHFAGSGFRIFAALLENEGHEIRAIPAPGGGSRRFCDRMNGYAQSEGLPGMGYIFWRHEEGKVVGAGPLAKNLGPERTEALRVQLGLGVGDAAFFLGGRPTSFEPFAAKARDKIATELGLVAQDRFEFCWIVDFPMFERDDETGGISFSHNPFSMPQGGIDSLRTQSPLDVLGFQYDIVCNGVELSSGAVRNHQLDCLYAAFAIAGHDQAFVDQHFSGMVNALKYGAPPHAGIAPGIERIVMLLAGVDNIREVTMFPLNQRAEDLLLGAPSEIDNESLRELGLRIAKGD
ncbi:MAG: aspartate--tRNA ligase [Rhodobacteraceae bacterium]|nr:aspartate--tRNA ligase [Paracoccaceae bacterium]